MTFAIRLYKDLALMSRDDQCIALHVVLYMFAGRQKRT